MPKQTRFTNELGNEISISIEKKDIEGIDGLYIAIAGPTSETTLHVTLKEAQILAQLLAENH